VKIEKEETMKKAVYTVIVCIVLLLPLPVQAASALQTTQSHVNRLLAVLGDQTLNDSAGEEKKKAAIRSISDSLFDFAVISKYALGPHWNQFTTKQQKTFVELFRQSLEGVYMDRLLRYKDEKVVFKNETALSETRSQVQSHIVSAGGNFAIDYRLYLKDGTWKVYDLIIEGVSLAKNYRVQFSSILSKEPQDKFLDILREKAKAQSSASK
jgi:phospholipid transport system substrate-binding protein